MLQYFVHKQNNELKRVGGISVNKTVYNTLRQLLSRDLASKLRFTKDSGKIAFGDKRVAKCVKGLLHETLKILYEINYYMF